MPACIIILWLLLARWVDCRTEISARLDSAKRPTASPQFPDRFISLVFSSVSIILLRAAIESKVRAASLASIAAYFAAIAADFDLWTE